MVLESVYLTSCANLLNVEEQVLISELNKLTLKRRKKSYQETPELENSYSDENELDQKKPINITSFFVEKECIRMLINYGNEKYDERAEHCGICATRN